MTPAQLQALASAQQLQIERHLRAMSGVYWLGPLQAGESGQFNARDLAIAKREREEQKGRN